MKKTNKEKQMEDLGLPKNYIYCFQSQCPSAKSCTRILAVQHSGEQKIGKVVLPAAMEGDRCPWYQPKRTIHGAWGFTSLFAEVKAKDAPILRGAIKQYLGGNGSYYRFHHGQHLLTPEQQDWIIDLFKRYGYTEGLQFDGYRDTYDW